MPSKVGAQSQSETNKHGRAYKAPWHEAVPKKGSAIQILNSWICTLLWEVKYLKYDF